MAKDYMVKRMPIKSLKNEDWDTILKRIMTSYDDISKSINPKGLLKINLTSSQIKLLACFSNKDVYTMTALSQMLSVSMPTMTAMVDRLVKSKMVARDRDAEDRRVVRVWLTELGESMLKKLTRIRRKEMEKILMNLDGNEMSDFLSSIEMVAQLLKKARDKRDKKETTH